MHERMRKVQKNLSDIRSIMTSWAKAPLFVRKDGKKDTVLCIEERAERTKTRYNEIENVAKRVHNLLEENLGLFRMEGKMNEDFWEDYVIFVDDIVLKNMLLTVGVR